MSDPKKFKKEIKIYCPTTDKEQFLIISPGTKGFVVLSNDSGTFKVGVESSVLREAVHEAEVMQELYCKDEKKETVIGDSFEYGDD